MNQAPPCNDAGVKKRRKRRGGPNARGEARRKLLLDSAELLLGKKGANKMTFADVATEAGLPLSSCYHFYRNKLDIIQAVNERMGARFLSEVIEQDISAERMDTWEDAIDLYCYESDQFFKRYPVAAEIFWSPSLPPSVQVRTFSRTRIIGNPFRRYLSEHFLLPDIPDIEPVFLVTFEILEQLYAIAHRENDKTGFYQQEAKRAAKAYLRCYIPPVLAKK